MQLVSLMPPLVIKGYTILYKQNCHVIYHSKRQGHIIYLIIYLLVQSWQSVVTQYRYCLIHYHSKRVKFKWPSYLSKLFVMILLADYIAFMH